VTAPSTVRLGGRTTVSTEDFRRLSSALNRGMTRQQLRAWSREHLGRGLSNDAVRELRSLARERRAAADALQRTGRGKRPDPRRLPTVQSSGPERFEVTAVAVISVQGRAVERQLTFTVRSLRARSSLEMRAADIAGRMAASDAGSGGSVLSVAVVSIVRFEAGR